MPEVWLIYGGAGWLGSQFVHYPQNVHMIIASARCDDVEEVRKEIEHIRPDRILIFIGRTSGEGFTSIDYLEQKGKIKENIRDNLFAPLVMALICSEMNIHLTYIGTGCIFKDYEKHVYQTTDNPNFFGSQYSLVKGYTDRLMKFFEKNVLNVRIRMPISYQRHPKNLLTKLTNYKQVYSSPNSVTVIEDLFPVLVEMVKSGRTGTVHLVNPGYITHEEILRMYKDIVDPSFEFKLVAEEDLPVVAERSHCILHSDLDDVPSALESIRKIFESWKKL